MTMRWLPLVPRVVLVTALAVPALSKFYAYGANVAQFRDQFGIPFADVLVPIVGAVEVTVLVGVALGIAGRLLALPMIGIMLGAFATAGPSIASVLVFLASLGILAIGTGPYSLWRPEERRLALRRR